MVEEDVVASYTVGPTQPPAFDGSVDYWERSPDPAHPNAFKGTELEGSFTTKVPQRQGWMAIDWIENPIGFVADGTRIPGIAPKFELIEAPHPALPSGHSIAVRIYDNWFSAAKCVKHDGVYHEVEPTVEALFRESQRDDVKFLIVSKERWNEMIGSFDALLVRDVNLANCLEGAYGTLNDKPVYTDAFESSDNKQQIFPGRQFSVRKRTEKLIMDTTVYPLFHGVAGWKK